MTLFEARGLSTWFPLKGGVFSHTIGHVKAVDGVDLKLDESEIVAVVGESGCGKSTLGQALVGLLPVTSGELFLEGKRVDGAGKRAWDARRKDFQIIFQDPFTSLNPRHTVYRILAEPLLLHAVCKPAQVRSHAEKLLVSVGLSAGCLDRFPHEFSGGQRQRIAIARSIGVRPRALVCDEVVSALDVSVQAQIIRLLLELKRTMGLSLLFITHDLSLVKVISDRVYVMYLGKIIEAAPAKTLFRHPRHPYTAALLKSVPTLDRSVRPAVLGGEIPSPVNVPKGCVFRGRCQFAKELCSSKHPEMTGDDAATVACFFPLG